jgi:hypothetical protein
MSHAISELFGYLNKSWFTTTIFGNIMKQSSNCLILIPARLDN